MRFLKIFLIFLFLISPILAVNAQGEYGLTETTKDLDIIKGESADPAGIVGEIIKIVLSFVGVVSTGLIVYGGFLWMTSRGNQQKTEQAKGLLVWAVLGIITIASAYVLVSFIGGSLAEQFF